MGEANFDNLELGVKMKLNLEYYVSKEDSKLENKLIKIVNFISKYNESEYEENLQEINLDALQYFTTLGQNILNWYSFSKECVVLEIGGNFGELTGLLCKNAKEVVCVEENLKKAEIISKRHEDKKNLEIIVGNIESVDFKGKQFDYITLIGTLPYVSKNQGITSKDFIKKLEKLLKPDGKLLIAVDNRFGIKYFSRKSGFVFK